MSEKLVKDVLKDYTEAPISEMKDPWPIIQARVVQLHTQDAEPLTSEDIAGNKPSPLSQNHAGEVRARTVPPMPPRRSLRLNLAMGLIVLVVVGGLVASFVARSRTDVLIARRVDNTFLPAGKVRHIVITGVRTIDRSAIKGTIDTTEEHHEEMWLAQGQEHPLMRDFVTVPISSVVWLDDNAYYEYDPAQSNQVTQSAYDPQVLASILPDPDIISKTLAMQNSHLVGNATLDGRAVVVITVSSSPISGPTPDAKAGASYKNTVYTYWIDPQSNQLLQVQMELTTVGGPQNGVVDRTVNITSLDELLNRSVFPADFFNFALPANTILVKEEATPVPTTLPAQLVPVTP